MYNIVLWGAGAVYNKHLNTLKLYEKVGELKVVGITAKALQGVKKLDGYKVYSTEELGLLEYDYLMIMNERNFREIVDEAIQAGVSKDKIISYRILELPEINFDDYFKLRASKVTIISDNCWGGIAYKTLGLECISPFKNLFLKEDHYLKLLSNLSYYMNQDLQFAYYCEDEAKKVKYPVMRLDDVYIHFNHDVDGEAATQKWERRKKKINYDNLFVEMYTKDVEAARRFSQLDAYEKKLCFVNFETDIECCMQLDSKEKESEFWKTVNENAGIEAIFNLVDLLNMKRKYRME